MFDGRLTLQTPTTTELYDAVTAGTTPTVGPRHVYVTDRATGVRAFDPRTGETVWTHETDDVAQTAPVVADDAVYFQSGNRLCALDAATGETRWETDRGHFENRADSVVSAAGRLVFGSSGVHVLGPDGSGWEYAAYEGIVEGVAVTGDGVLATTRTESGGAIHAVSESGRRRWTVSVENRPATPPVVADDTVFVATRTNALVAFDAADGSRRWRRSYPGTGSFAPPSFDPETGTAYYATGSLGRLVAVGRDGDERWTTEVGRHLGTQPVHDGRTVYAPGSSLVALDAADGTERWRLDGLATRSGVGLSGNAVWVASEQRLVRVTG